MDIFLTTINPSLLWISLILHFLREKVRFTETWANQIVLSLIRELYVLVVSVIILIILSLVQILVLFYLMGRVSLQIV
jgi:hypothetical protein